MAEVKNQEKRPQSVLKKRRRGSSVPTSLVIVLLILALVMGGLGGFALARSTDPARRELAQLRERNTNMENILTSIGFTVGEDDPDSWVMNDGELSEEDALAAISSDGEEDDGETVDDVADLFDDDAVLSGTLSEDQDTVVVAEFKGGTVTSDEVIPAYNEEITNMILQGEDAEEIAGSVLQDVVTQAVGQKLMLKEARDMGLDKLTDADTAEIEAAAQAEYDGNLSFARDVVADEGMSEEEIAAAAEAYLKEESGITLNSLIQDAKERWLEEKYRQTVVTDISVTDEEVQAHYSELLEQQKADFDEVPDNFFYSHLYGGVVVYNPEGFRAVRDILIPFDSAEDGELAEDLMDEMAGLDINTQADEYNEAKEQLDALYAPLDKIAEEALEKLNGGASFAELMDEYGCSEDLASEPLRSQGYYINSDSVLISSEYVEGSMMLETAGQISTPLRSGQGLHLVQYLGEVAPGEVPLEDVKQAVSAEVLAEKEEEAYIAHMNDLIDKANVKYYTDRLQ